MKTILLKLSGPMQAWGTNSKFETRYTDHYPSKSAIIGMLAASLGYRRDDDRISKLNNIDFAVRVDQKPNLIRDYHIASKYKKNGSLERNYVTNRYYLEDGVFVVAIGSSDDQIEKLYKALENPYFQTYMGRRSCPPPADFLIGVRDVGPIEALKDFSWQASSHFKKNNPNYRADLYADSHLLDGKEKIRNDKVLSFSFGKRQYIPRFESESYITFSNETNHDPFEVL